MYIQSVLALGVWVVIAALVPIVVSHFGVHDEALWRPCAVVPLAIWGMFLIVTSRTAASRAINRSPERLDRLFPVLGLPLHLVLAGSLLAIVIGLWPGIDEALYITSLAAGVIFAGYTLVMSGMSQTAVSSPDQDER